MTLTRGRFLLFSIIVLCGPGHPNAQTSPGPVIDASRRTDWSQPGVPGGIPNRTKICTTLSPGVTNAQITSAIAACSADAGGVVVLKPGTYTLSGPISFTGSSHVTLRGTGPDQTKVVFTAAPGACNGTWAHVCVAGSSQVWSGNIIPLGGRIMDWTDGYAQGKTQITLSSTTGLLKEQILILDQLQDTSDTGGIIESYAPGFTIEGTAPGRPGRPQQQFVKITEINGNQVTIFPGLHMPNWRTSQQPQAWTWGGPSVTSQMNGIEDLALDYTATPTNTGHSGIGFNNAYTGWVKNVKSLNTNRNHVWLSQAARIEVRDSYFYGTKNSASQSYGVETFTGSDNLVINNIFQHVTTPIMMGNSAGCVIAYNFMIDMAYYIPTWMMVAISGSHDAGTGMNLFEGNAGNSFGMDLFHGVGALPTLFRNQLIGIEPGKTQANTNVINIWAFNRFVNVVGNVLGTSGYHTVYEDSRTPSGTTGNPSRSIYLLGYAASGEQAPYNGVPYDPLVVSTMFRWGNYDYATETARWNASEVPADQPVPDPQILPPSLFLASKPPWWGPMPWPPIGPDVMGGQDVSGHAYDIPAKVCYLKTPQTNGILNFNARNCYGGTPGAAPAPPTNLRVQ